MPLLDRVDAWRGELASCGLRRHRAHDRAHRVRTVAGIAAADRGRFGPADRRVLDPRVRARLRPHARRARDRIARRPRDARVLSADADVLPAQSALRAIVAARGGFLPRGDLAFGMARARRPPLGMERPALPARTGMNAAARDASNADLWNLDALARCGHRRTSDRQ